MIFKMLLQMEMEHFIFCATFVLLMFIHLHKTFEIFFFFLVFPLPFYNHITYAISFLISIRSPAPISRSL